MMMTMGILGMSARVTFFLQLWVRATSLLKFQETEGSFLWGGPGNPPTGIAQCHQRPSTFFFFRFACNLGFQLVGDTISHCVGQSWSHTSLPVCASISDNDDGDFAGDYVVVDDDDDNDDDCDKDDFHHHTLRKRLWWAGNCWFLQVRQSYQRSGWGSLPVRNCECLLFININDDDDSFDVDDNVDDDDEKLQQLPTGSVVQLSHHWSDQPPSTVMDRTGTQGCHRLHCHHR